MERKEQVQYDFCGVPRDFSHLKRLVGMKQLIEHPVARWIREYEREPTQEEMAFPRFLEYKRIFDLEIDHFSKLETIANSILYCDPLPQYKEEELRSLFTRFPCISFYLEGHIERSCESVELYMNAIMSYVPEKNYHELDYVVRSSLNGLETKIPYNEQFRASRYVPYEMEVPPSPEGYVAIDARTLINKCPMDIPELIVDTLSAQAEVDLDEPLAVVFRIVDDDPQIGGPREVRVKWDERGTTLTNQPVGLYSGGVKVRFDQSIGINVGKDYVMLQNGVMRYATAKCYVTVFCDKQKIRTRDQYVLGDTDKFGIWRYEVTEKRLIRPVGGQPDFYEDVRLKIIASRRFEVERTRLVGFPLPQHLVSWNISPHNTLYLGRSVKRNKILLKLKDGGLKDIEDYFIVFASKFPKCVYFGDKRLLIGEHGVRKRTYEVEFKRYPHYYESFKGDRE